MRHHLALEAGAGDECKDYATNDNSEEKKLLGEVWAKVSNGKAKFLMALKKDERGRNVHEQIRGTIEGW